MARLVDLVAIPGFTVRASWGLRNSLTLSRSLKINGTLMAPLSNSPI